MLQVPLLGHGGAIETLNLVCRYNSPNEALALVLVPCLLPLGYVTNFVTPLLNFLFHYLVLLFHIDT